MKGNVAEMVQEPKNDQLSVTQSVGFASMHAIIHKTVASPTGAKIDNNIRTIAYFEEKKCKTKFNFTSANVLQK